MKSIYYIFVLLLILNPEKVLSSKIVQQDVIKIRITGTLINENDESVKNATMEIYVGTTEEVLKADPSKKQGSLTPVEGTGKVNLSIVGVEGGGALKLVNGGVSNPTVKTDENGVFQFELSEKFLKGEKILIITMPKNNVSSGITESFPIVDSEGKPLTFHIEEMADFVELGKVKILEK